MFPGTPDAVRRLLERLGCTVVFPRQQTCCGQMFTNTGYFDEAVPSVRTFVEAFDTFDYVVGPSGSCVGAVRHQHPMLARHAGDAGLERAVGELTPRVYDLSEFIVDVLGTVDVGAWFPGSDEHRP
ncbi:(Fe-S)-binding protein [Propioniciclava sp. MC1683]|nr:(Fe-S)-binding protein [Propioniciclava sp. MC1683]